MELRINCVRINRSQPVIIFFQLVDDAYAFYARVTTDTTVDSSPLIFNEVAVNDAGAYNPSTGR